MGRYVKCLHITSFLRNGKLMVIGNNNNNKIAQTSEEEATLEIFAYIM
jgi:hypothetical protein